MRRCVLWLLMLHWSYNKDARLIWVKPVSCFDRSKAVLLLLVMFCVCLCICNAVLSVPCSIVIICLKRAYLLALLCVVFSCAFVTFHR